MWFWWFMLLCDMLVPIVMVIVGRMMWKHCPKHINSLVGLILVAIQCFIMVASIYPTEKALKKHFNDDGTRK